MGVVNVTPDSFSDGGQFHTVKEAGEYALKCVKEGVDILDIGGESSRPGAEPVSVSNEKDRVLPVIDYIRSKNDAVISIDTMKPEVAEAALQIGANIINDISGVRDPEMISLAASQKTPTIIMHMLGNPRTMQLNPEYENLIEEIKSFLLDQAGKLIAAGLPENHVILDPGLGFGKTVQDNFLILKNLNQFSQYGHPVLIGPSRKSFIGNTLNEPPENRVMGTAAAVTAAIMHGARIIRVHDIKAMKQVVLITEAILGCS